MKIRNLVLIGIIATIVIVVITIMITKSNYSSQGNEDNYSSEEDVEMITVSVKNSTGKTINVLYSYQENNERYTNNGDPIWIDTLEDQPLEAGDSRNIQLESIFYDDLWDFMIVTEDDETYEMKEILSTNYVYDGAELEFVIVDDYLDVVDNSSDEESEEDVNYQEENVEQEESYVEVVEDEDSIEVEEQEEHNDEEENNEEEYNEDNNEETNEEEYYLEDFEVTTSEEE